MTCSIPSVTMATRRDERILSALGGTGEPRAWCPRCPHSRPPCLPLVVAQCMSYCTSLKTHITMAATLPHTIPVTFQPIGPRCHHYRRIQWVLRAHAVPDGGGDRPQLPLPTGAPNRQGAGTKFCTPYPCTPCPCPCTCTPYRCAPCPLYTLPLYTMPLSMYLYSLPLYTMPLVHLTLVHHAPGHAPLCLYL